MGSVIACDIILAVFSIYIGIFLKKKSTIYPNMDIGFHIMEVCHNKETWNYGNAFAGNLSIFLGIIFFIIIFPLSLIFKFQRTFYIFFLLFLALCYVLLMFLIVKYKIKKKFNLKKRN